MAGGTDNDSVAKLRIAPGDLVAGKYRVEKLLGRGGMGAVMAAVHAQLGTRVALKFLLPKFADHPVVRARFEREGRASVRLRSVHATKIYDVGVLDSGAPFLVMEFLEGHDLHDHLSKYSPIPVADVVDFVLQASEVIAEAHALGIVHRDLKPENLFMSRGVDGRPLIKVLDFGISKMTETPGERGLTNTGEIIGSPHYMSPEQLRGSAEVDTRTDIWALGGILYTLLAGRPPFDGENMAQLCTRVILEEPAPLMALRPDTPPALAEVVMRCLRKDRNERFASVPELANALLDFSRAPLAGGTSLSLAATVPSLPPIPPTRKRSSAALVATVALVSLGAGGLIALRLAKPTGQTASLQPAISAPAPPAPSATITASAAASASSSASPPSVPSVAPVTSESPPSTSSVKPSRPVARPQQKQRPQQKLDDAPPDQRQ